MRLALELLVLGVVIGANNLATSLALGALVEARRHWRIVSTFAVFEFPVPLSGIWLGQQAARSVQEHADWIGPVLIAGTGGWTILAAGTESVDEEALARRVTSWAGLAILSAGLSLDNLVIGFSLGLGNRDPLLIASTIAVCSASFAWIGLRLGATSRRVWQTPSQIAAGVLLLGLAAATRLGWL